MGRSKITHLLANGCSNTCAIDPEQPGQNFFRPDDVYPGLLRKNFEIENYDNIALGGGSNDRILRTTMNWVAEYLSSGKSPNELFVIIGWTQPTRREFVWNKIEELKENSFLQDFFPFNRFWPGAFEMSDDEFFIGDAQRYWKLFLKYGINEFAEQKRWLNQVIALQALLKSKGISYLFINTAGHFTFRELEAEAKSIDQTCYFNMFDPDIKTAHQRNNKILFGKKYHSMFDLDWNGHFGVDFHQHFANELREFINENNLI